MAKNFIIAFLIVIIALLGGYILLLKQVQEAPAVPSMQIAPSAPAPAAPVTPEKTSVVFLNHGGATTGDVLSSLDLSNNTVTEIAKGYAINPVVAEDTDVIFQKTGTWNDVSKTWNDPKKTDDLMRYTSPDNTVHEVKNLITSPGIGRSGVLSADGTKLFYVTSPEGDCKTPQELHSVDLSSGVDTDIASLATNPFGAAVKNSCEDASLVGLSSDGTKLYMTAGSPVQAGTQDAGLYVYSLATNAFLPSMDPTNTMVGAKLSPDGTKLAYIPYASTSPVTGWIPVKPYEVNVLNLGTGATSTILTNTTNPYTALWWSDDGSELLYGMDSMKKSSELSELSTYDVLDISSAVSTDVPLDYTSTNTNTVLSYDGSLLLFEDTVENSPDTNADDDHQLKLYNFKDGSTKMLNSYTGAGGYGFAALFD